MRLIDFLVGDDIRMEVGGKTSVMGIYNELMRLGVPSEFSWPLPMRLGMFARFALDEEDQRPTGFRVSIRHDDKELGRFEGEIKMQHEASLISLPLVAFPIPLPGPGVLRFDLSLLHDGQEIFSTESPIPIRVETTTKA